MSDPSNPPPARLSNSVVELPPPVNPTRRSTGLVAARGLVLQTMDAARRLLGRFPARSVRNFVSAGEDIIGQVRRRVPRQAGNGHTRDSMVLVSSRGLHEDDADTSIYDSPDRDGDDEPLIPH